MVLCVFSSSFSYVLLYCLLWMFHHSREMKHTKAYLLIHLVLKVFYTFKMCVQMTRDNAWWWANRTKHWSALTTKSSHIVGRSMVWAFNHAIVDVILLDCIGSTILQSIKWCECNLLLYKLMDDTINAYAYIHPSKTTSYNLHYSMSKPSICFDWKAFTDIWVKIQKHFLNSCVNFNSWERHFT